MEDTPPENKTSITDNKTGSIVQYSTMDWYTSREQDFNNWQQDFHNWEQDFNNWRLRPLQFLYLEPQ